MTLLDWYDQAQLPREVACRVFGYADSCLTDTVDRADMERYITDADLLHIPSPDVRAAMRRHKARLIAEHLANLYRQPDVAALHREFARALWAGPVDYDRLRALVVAVSAIEPSSCVGLAALTAALQNVPDCRWDQLERWLRWRDVGRVGQASAWPPRR